MNIGQSLASTITVTAIGCNTNSILSNTVMQNLAPTVSITNGGNATLITQCYENNTVTSKKIGNLYSGYLIVNYTNPSSSFTHTAIGTLIVRSTTQAVSTSTSSTTI